MSHYRSTGHRIARAKAHTPAYARPVQHIALYAMPVPDSARHTAAYAMPVPGIAQHARTQRDHIEEATHSSCTLSRDCGFFCVF
eukprot:3236448-Rhodomonas_salina.1